jgi:hypothetical protein
MLDSFRTRRLDFWTQGHSETSERAGALSAATQIQEGSDPDSGSHGPQFRTQRDARAQIQDTGGQIQAQRPKLPKRKTQELKFRTQ